ncbi:MAG: ribose 5-phosphate isomerase B [Candidatus Wallbacteria bacterium]|nr:ribose 5-phosphate isomerase B [Candidatus Wallbacteria bacterium]
MIIAIGSDHAGFEYKEIIREHLTSMSHEVQDLGTNSTERCDYPDFAEKVAKAVVSGKAGLGILVCGTGIGMSISANKVRGCRAALVSDSLTARLSREHNDANVLCLGSRIIGIETAKDAVNAFIKSGFAGDRHQLRLNKIKELEDGKN